MVNFGPQTAEIC